MGLFINAWHPQGERLIIPRSVMVSQCEREIDNMDENIKLDSLVLMKCQLFYYRRQWTEGGGQ